MPDYDALRLAWPPSGTLEQKLAHVNGLMVDGPTVDIPLPAIREKLQARMAHLECYALAAKTRDIRRRLNMPQVPQPVVSAIYLLQLMASAEKAIGMHKLPVLKSLLADLVSDEASGISSEDADSILALSRSSVSWWSRNGFSAPVNTYDAIEARLS
jgi:hypothetical protein